MPKTVWRRGDGFENFVTRLAQSRVGSSDRELLLNLRGTEEMICGGPTVTTAARTVAWLAHAHQRSYQICTIAIVEGFDSSGKLRCILLEVWHPERSSFNLQGS